MTTTVKPATEQQAKLEAAPAPKAAGDEQPRRLRPRTLDEVASVVGSAAGSLALTWLLYLRILPLYGFLGFLLVWFTLFLVMYAGVTAVTNPRPVVVDRLAAAVVGAGALVVGVALLSTVLYTFIRGIKALGHLNIFVNDMGGVSPQAPLEQGGVLHAIVGSLIQLGIAVVIAMPLGIAVAIYMTEVGGRLARMTRTLVEAMTGLPDILAGLFVYVVLVVGFQFPKGGFAASLALSVTMLPIIARAADVVLRVVPGGLREAGLALGASHWQTVWRVVLPTARPGLATAVILGMARAIGETAPVLIVSGASTFLNVNPFNYTMNSLPLFAFTAVRSGQELYIQRGFAAASILLGVVMLLFVVIRWVARSRVGGR